MSLAVKYRPKTWNDVVSQVNIINILEKQIQTDNIKNSYIFSGASGTGKTTCARIFANEINNHEGSPIEIDAASNNGVDNVKQIVASASERSINSKYKVYIIDEAHMLSNQAWNAFLKCIEETPKYTIFIFCTTDPQKIPDTIKNRCMRFTFNRIPTNEIYDRLLYICMNENLTSCEAACDYISRICKGEMRNAISLLETCMDYSHNLSMDNVLNAIGNFSYDLYFDLINNIIDGDHLKVFSIVDDIYNSGKDMKMFVNSFTSFVLDVVKYSVSNDIKLTKIPSVYEDKLKYTVAIDNASKYYFYMIDKLLELKTMMKNDMDIKSVIDITFSQMTRLV